MPAARGDELTIGRAVPATTLRGVTILPPNVGDTPDFITVNGAQYIRWDMALTMMRKETKMTKREREFIKARRVGK